MLLETMLIAVSCLIVAVVLWIQRQKASLSKPKANYASHSALAPGPLAASQTAALIRSRRSIFPKDMNGQKISSEEVRLLLEAANWAPTHGKTEPWRFVVLSTPEAQQRAFATALKVSERLLDPGKELDKRRAKTANWTDAYFPKLSHIILLGCRRAPNVNGKMMPEWEDMAAVAAAVQNMHLMATSMGLAGYWSSWPTEDVRASLEWKAHLGWEQQDICMGMFVLGRSGIAEAYRAKRGPIMDKVKWLEA